MPAGDRGAGWKWINGVRAEDGIEVSLRTRGGGVPHAPGPAPKRFGGAGRAGQNTAKLRAAKGKPEPFPGGPAIIARRTTDGRNIPRCQSDGTGPAHQTARAHCAVE